MNKMCYKDYNFNVNLSEWNVEKISDTCAMFWMNYYFNADLSKCNVG